MSFSLTAKQNEALLTLGGPSTHVLLYGGSRSGKTFLILRAIITRALAAARSRHAVLRFRFNHVKASIIHDTLPKVMESCFPKLPYRVDKSDWFLELPNQSQVWFGGLDEKERTEKILGQEHSTIFLNEVSQIPWASVNLAVTRLAQKAYYTLDGKQRELRLKMFYDENPPSKGHWSHRVFIDKKDPETKQILKRPEDYAFFGPINPSDNSENLGSGYLQMLEGLSARSRKRFSEGKFADLTENALWTSDLIDKWRDVTDLPDMQRIIIGVDPSGSGDEDNAGNDEIGIIVGGLGTDGNAYVLEDLTLKSGPQTWGKVTTSAFDRHQADKIVAETNFGGEMVKFVVQTAKPGVPFKKLTASRGKSVRAEPISALTENGKIRFAGNFQKLEDELCEFTTDGYKGTGSPNRADAFVWVMSELFPGLVKEEAKAKNTTQPVYYGGEASWMG